MALSKVELVGISNKIPYTKIKLKSLKLRKQILRQIVDKTELRNTIL